MIRSLLLLCCMTSSAAVAEQRQVFGDFVVHYSAQSSSELSPEVAKQYSLSRSPRLALVMITVQKKTGDAVRAAVTGQARNLLGQTQALELREIEEGASIYYLGLLSISNRETQAFALSIRPEGSPHSYELRFNQQFFVD